MIINNTHVQGIFIYSDSIEYEKGDFVVYNSTLYVCTAENPTNTTNMSVMGIKPDEDIKNYNIYPGNRISTAEEYFDYLDDPNTKEDKYVSSHSLSQILSTYMNGFDEKGVISNYIISNGGTLTYSNNLSEYLSSISSSSDVLSIILNVSDLNNAIFRISRNLVSNILPVDSSNSSVILKQYTYLDTATSQINPPTFRIQELIDHVSGIVFFRYASKTDSETSFNNITSWKRGAIDEDFLEEVNHVYNYYEQESNKLAIEKQQLGNNFGFRNVSIVKGSSVTLQCNDPEGDEEGYYIQTKLGSDGSRLDFSSSCIISIVATINIPNSTLRKNVNTTIDLSDSVNNIINTYYLSDTAILTVNSINNSQVKLSLSQITSTGEVENSGVIVNVYYRNYYE